MNFFPIKKHKAGIEITADKIKSALIVKKGKTFCIKNLSDIELPPGTLKPSFKKENILDIAAFKDGLVKIYKDINCKKISLALPDAVIKVFIKKFPQLPLEPREVDNMISWDISSSLNVPPEDLRVSWENMGVNSEGDHVFIVALGIEKILFQYEDVFKQAGITPKIIAPAGLSQFNFYSQIIPEQGHAAYLGLFDDAVNIFVFLDGVPVFYKTVKKGMLGEHGGSAINDIDLLLQYYHSENPDLGIDRFYIASHIKSETQMSQILNDVGDIDFDIIEERNLILFDKKIALRPETKPLPFYTSAIGTAQGV